MTLAGSLSSSETPVYYTSPTRTEDEESSNNNNNRGIVLFTDVWGFTPRAFEICDFFASKGGYHVISPDCFRGETKGTHGNEDMAAWLRKFPYHNLVKDDISACLDFLHNHCQVPSTDNNIGAIGFCWGGWAIAKSASEGIPWKVGVSPHPSTKIERAAFDGDEEAMLEKVSMPFLLLPAGNDAENLKPGSETVKALESKGGKSILFDEMVHGWVTRGDQNDENTAVKRDADAALQHALDFFKKHL
jgi:dienelactone hydrolase